LPLWDPGMESGMTEDRLNIILHTGLTTNLTAIPAQAGIS